MPQPRQTRSTPLPSRPPGSRSRRARGLGAALALAGAALLVPAIGHSGPPAAGTAGLAGQLLVATEAMPDPRFSRTVIYVVRHDASGSHGLIVNRPLREVPLAVLLERTGVEDKAARGTVRLYAGGPVDPRRLFVLHTADYSAPGTLLVRDGFALTWEPDILHAIVRGRGPRRTLVALGYAGWAPGQLEAEMKTGAWARATADEALVFDDDSATKWSRAMARRILDL
jgi:putative transcriptional regulator